MRRERATRIGVCVLLLATVVLTGCRLAERGRRAAIDAFASFVLDSVYQAPLTQAAPKHLAASSPTQQRHECLSSTATKPKPEIKPLPLPAPRMAAIDLTPAACRLPRVNLGELARVRLEARMALAEVRGQGFVQVRRVVIVAPQPPATL